MCLCRVTDIHVPYICMDASVYIFLMCKIHTIFLSCLYCIVVKFIKTFVLDGCGRNTEILSFIKVEMAHCKMLLRGKSGMQIGILSWVFRIILIKVLDNGDFRLFVTLDE